MVVGEVKQEDPRIQALDREYPYNYRTSTCQELEPSIAELHLNLCNGSYSAPCVQVRWRRARRVHCLRRRLVNIGDFGKRVAVNDVLHKRTSIIIAVVS